MSSKVELVRLVLKDVLRVQITEAEAEKVLARIEALHEKEAVEHSVHLTGGSRVVGEANSENYVRWQNGDLPEEPASR